MNSPRPSLRLDLKALSPRPAPNTRIMVSVVAVGLMAGVLYALFSTLISVNSPSASAANSDRTPPPTHQEDLISDSVPRPNPPEPVQQIPADSLPVSHATETRPIIPVGPAPEPVATSEDVPPKPQPTAIIPLTGSTASSMQADPGPKSPPALRLPEGDVPARNTDRRRQSPDPSNRSANMAKSGGFPEAPSLSNSRAPTLDPSLQLASLPPGLSPSSVPSPESPGHAARMESRPQGTSPVDVVSTPEATGHGALSPQTGTADSRLQLASLLHVPGQSATPALDQLLKDRLPEPEPEPLPDPLMSALHEGEWITETVRRKDTLTNVLKRLGFGIREALALVKLEQASVLERIHPGQEIHITRLPPEDGHPKKRLGKLKFQLSQFETLLVRHQDNGYVADVIRREPEVRYRLSQATIHHDLLGAAKEAGIPQGIVYSVANILGWQIDFTRDIQPGDQFKVIYEELYLDGLLVEHGQVVATELTTRQRKLQAVRHVNETGRTTYYTPSGEGIQSSFLRSPIKFARVTSNFSKRRLHPIAKTWRAHNGVDYGAPMNTPIRSTGDGVVEFAGTKTGYGKTLILRHGMTYKTLYAHLNRFQKGIRVGGRVQQGDIIGYVGQTGWATGPHLHYEFRVNGRHMNPLTVELPKSSPIDPHHMDEFTREAALWVARLERSDQVQFARTGP